MYVWIDLLREQKCIAQYVYVCVVFEGLAGGVQLTTLLLLQNAEP